MDLIHPQSKAEVVDAVRRANADRRRLLVVGGRRHLDKGNPAEFDAELWTTQLDRLIAYEPAEMIVVAEAGMRMGELGRILAAGGQEWPADAPEDATIGGALAAGASSARRLKVGALRDTVLEAEVVTGDGRFIRSGARTVKNVTGYDLHKLVVGSLGTLGVIVQVALKVRPLPETKRTLRFARAPGIAEAILAAVPAAAAVISTPDGIELRLEGWSAEVDEQALLASAIAAPIDAIVDARFPGLRPWDERPVVAEVAVPPSRIAEVVPADAWGALTGVGIAWCGLHSPDGELTALRERAHAVGGIAPVVRGPGGLGNPPVPAPEVQRRLKNAFDPNGVLAPGRGWGGA
jgi:glycolate oxidase FAD binding subunit